MDWTAILAAAGIPEPPGRLEAIAATNKHTARKHELTGGPKRAKGSNSRKPVQVSRKVLQDRERKAGR